MDLRSLMKKSRGKSSLIGLLIALGMLGVFALVVWSATLFEDDFTPPSGGWLSGPGAQGNAKWDFSNGEYQVLVTRPDSVSRSLAPTVESSPEFCLETDARQLPFSYGETGLVFGFNRHDGQETFGTFGVFADGSYRLGRFTQGEIENLPVTTAPTKLSYNDYNNLKIVCKNGIVEFYGNDTLLASAEADQLGLEVGGKAGFFGHSSIGSFTVGSFDYIKLMTPDCDP